MSLNYIREAEEKVDNMTTFMVKGNLLIFNTVWKNEKFISTFIEAFGKKPFINLYLIVLV